MLRHVTGSISSQVGDSQQSIAAALNGIHRLETQLSVKLILKVPLSRSIRRQGSRSRTLRRVSILPTQTLEMPYARAFSRPLTTLRWLMCRI